MLWFRGGGVSALNDVVALRIVPVAKSRILVDDRAIGLVRDGWMFGQQESVRFMTLTA